MLTNRNLVNAYLNSKRGKERIFQIISAKIRKDAEEVQKIADIWMKQFMRRWRRTSSRTRLEEREKDWLDSVSIKSNCVNHYLTVQTL